MGPSEKNFFDSLNKRSNSMHNDKTYAPASFVYFENWNDTVCLRAAPLHRLVPSSHGSYKNRVNPIPSERRRLVISAALFFLLISLSFASSSETTTTKTTAINL
ncbi:hypothetical protein HAX54_009709 [Datura stramonium]|uniref:Transmembrane protein n=1 Tax=Datura stramonium TaxID=4076 RepID=A0ABS8THU2_DATST|nr:hypothetical protein [Datura stramonium]